MFLPLVLLAVAIGADPIVQVAPQAGALNVRTGAIGVEAGALAPPPLSTLPRYPAWPATVSPQVTAPQRSGPEYQLNDWQWRNGLLQPGTPPPAQPDVKPLSPLRIPFIGPAMALENTLGYYDPFTRQFAFGNAGFQPYRLGWYFYDEVPYMPTSPVRGVPGSFQDVQYNTWVRYAQTMGDRLLFSWTGSWNSAWWTGPSGVNLPADVEQLIADFQISSLNAGPWNWQIGITPQLNADFHRALDHNAYMLDGRFVLFYQAAPELRLAAGLAYWNRVRGIIIPYGGVLWSPNDRWEFRVFFPQTRISRYYGNVNGTDVWNYASIGWNVNAWQVTIQDETAAKTRMQMSYAELLAGVSAASGLWTAFLEGGLIFDRRVLFRSYAPPFTINSNLMVRIGVLY